MAIILLLLGLGLAIAGTGAQDACYNHVLDNCDGHDAWTEGQCNSIHGGFLGNSNNLHKIIIDDFSDSINYMLMATQFSTDASNQMGFYKFLMGKSDKMWTRGKDMVKYITKRGGKMGSGFQISGRANLGSEPVNELSSLGLSLDMMKARTENIITAYKHSYSKTNNGQGSSFDPTTAHLLEEITEDYADDIRDVAGKLNTLAKMVKHDKSRSLALHMFDNMLKQ